MIISGIPTGSREKTQNFAATCGNLAVCSKPGQRPYRTPHKIIKSMVLERKLQVRWFD
eukprot:SAG11_NODE_4986_length_1703_cov_1.437656_3_plen_58_part_01